jgi:diacylglycerol kinase
MKTILSSHHPVRQVKSFHYAFKGIVHTLLNEANFRTQILIAVTAVGFAIHYNITNTEWGLLIITLGALLSAEMLNTVVEEVIDTLIKDYQEAARIIKDVSAGFVLVTAITTLLILILIFGSRII